LKFLGETPRSRRLWAASGMAILLASALIAGLVRRHPPAPPPTARKDDRSLHFAFEWPRGATFTYGLTWQGQSRARLAGTGTGPANPAMDLEGSVMLAGDLVLRSHGPRAGGYLLGVRLDNVTRHDVELLGRPALPTDDSVRSSFDGREALVDVDREGAVKHVYFAKNAPPLFRYLMKSIAELSQVVIRNDVEGWSTTETTPVGRGGAEYTVEEADLPRLQRSRGFYDEVFGVRRSLHAEDENEIGNALIVLDPRGYLRSLEERETLVVHGDRAGKPDALVSHTIFELVLREMGSARDDDEPDLASLDSTQPDDVGAPVQDKILDQRIAGLSAEQLDRDLRSFALVGSVPDKDWLLRASGLLRRQPARCLDLVALFENSAMNSRGRAQIMDLLAGTGTPEAQEAMRLALASPVARDDAALFQSLVQRFSLVSRPTHDSLSFLATALQETSTGKARSAVALALGGATGNALLAGDSSAAERYGALILDKLARAHTAEDRRAWLGALGNLGWSGASTRVSELASDPDASVRAASAWALRKIESSDARDALVDLAGDASPEVEERALAALEANPAVGADDVRELARRVTERRTSPRADASLVSLLSKHPEAGEPAAAMLRVLLTRNESDKPLAAEIRHLLAAYP